MKHLLFDLIDCPPDLLDDEDFVRLSAWNAAKESKSELINISCHKFKPQGVTALAMLAESTELPKAITEAKHALLVRCGLSSPVRLHEQMKVSVQWPAQGRSVGLPRGAQIHIAARFRS